MSVGGTAQLRIRKSSSPCPETGGGKLHFQGALEKKKTFSYKRYWFVLHGDNLSYFKDERVSSPLSQGLIDMSQVHDVRLCTANRGYPFEIVTRTKRHVLSASSSSIRDQWLDYLRRAMKVQRPMSEFSASMSRPACNSIEDRDDLVFDQVQAMLKASGIGGRSVSVPEFMCDDSPVSSDPNSPALGEDLLRRKTLDFSSESPTQRDSGCESSSEPNNNNNSCSSPKDIDPRDSRVSVSSQSHPSRDSTELKYDPRILRKNKRAVARLHPTVSNAVASKFIYDSIHEDDVDVFADSTGSSVKQSLVATDSGLSSISSSTTGTSTAPVSPAPSQPSSMCGDMNFTFPAMPELPNPRLEMTWGTSPFDQIRLFLASNRGPDEFYPTPDRDERGKAMHKLKSFLVTIP